MQYFPATSSVLSAEALGVFLQRQYRFREQVDCRLLKTFVNDTYLVIDGSDRYIFRVYSLNWRTKLEISEEIRLIDTLQQNHIPVSFAIADAAGNYIQELAAPEGNRCGVLFSFAPGEKSLSLSADMHYKIGEMMGRIHQLTKDMTLTRITYNPPTLLVQSFEKYRSYLPEGSDDLRYMVDMQQYPLSPAIAKKMVSHFTGEPKSRFKTLLSNREQEILDQLMEGLSYKMIAHELRISVETVRRHIKHLYKKLNLISRGEIITRLMKN